MVATLQFSVLGCTHFFVLACHVADSFVADRCCLGKNVTFMNNLYPGPLTALAAFLIFRLDRIVFPSRLVKGKTFVLSGERLGRLMVQSAQDQASTINGLDGYGWIWMGDDVKKELMLFPMVLLIVIPCHLPTSDRIHHSHSHRLQQMQHRSISLV